MTSPSPRLLPRCRRDCHCICHGNLGQGAHHGMPCPGKVPEGTILAPRDDEYVITTDPCRAPTPGCPDGVHPATSTHHRRPRSLGGSNAASNLVRLCRAAHDWVHLNPAAAIDRGLLILPPHFDHAENPMVDCGCVTCGTTYVPPRRWWP